MDFGFWADRKFVEGPDNFVGHYTVKGIELFRTVEGDEGDTILVSGSEYESGVRGGHVL